MVFRSPEEGVSFSAFSSLKLSLIGIDTAYVFHIGVVHFFQLGYGLSGACACLAVDEDGSGLVMQEIHCIVDFFDRNISGASYVSAPVFLLCPYVQKNGSFCRAAAVDFIVDIYRF